MHQNGAALMEQNVSKPVTPEPRLSQVWPFVSLPLLLCLFSAIKQQESQPCPCPHALPDAKPASTSVLGRQQYIIVTDAAPVQMSMDGTTSEVGSRPPSESGDHPSKEAHKKGRFKVCLLHQAYPLTVLSCSLQRAVPSHAHGKQ